MKIFRRRLIQLAAFGFSNAQVLNLASGKIYKGGLKNFCAPGLNCYSCPAASFSCPIGAMQAVAATSGFNFGFYAAGIILAFGILFGRAVCGFLCPFGFFQELLHKIPTPKKILWRPLMYAKYFVLAVFVLILPLTLTNYAGVGLPAFCQYICPAGTLEGSLPLLATRPELRQVVGSLFAWKFFILVVVIFGSVIFYRFFCRVLCPLGAIYGLLNRISFYRLTVDENLCINCGRCKKICGMNVDPVRQNDSAECIRCGECAAACPKKAIAINFSTSLEKRDDCLE